MKFWIRYLGFPALSVFLAGSCRRCSEKAYEWMGIWGSGRLCHVSCSLMVVHGRSFDAGSQVLISLHFLCQHYHHRICFRWVRLLIPFYNFFEDAYSAITMGAKHSSLGTLVVGGKLSAETYKQIIHYYRDCTYLSSYLTSATPHSWSQNTNAFAISLTRT